MIAITTQGVSCALSGGSVQDHTNQQRLGTTYNNFLPNAQGVIIGEQQNPEQQRRHRPEEICRLELNCLTRDSQNKPVLLYDNWKEQRIGRQLPIHGPTAERHAAARSSIFRRPGQETPPSQPERCACWGRIKWDTVVITGGERFLAKQRKKHGMRIPYVVDDLGITYDRHANDVRPHPPYVPPLKCKGCGIPVSARSSNADDPDSRSSHYFKLPGRDHTPTCTYDLKRRGKQLVDTSQGTVIRRDGQWRLKCPPLERPGTRGGTKGPSGPARPPRGCGGGGTRPTSKLRGPAIASARRIVELLEDFGQDPEAVAEFAAVAPGGQMRASAASLMPIGKYLSWPVCKKRSAVKFSQPSADVLFSHRPTEQSAEEVCVSTARACV
ncbi:MULTISPECIES: hypothetical protein [unclassified Streptomyces]|uniref:hypothetical protein n=1 Tax=unclassified Streptomyces TaxID=2593676 RepID=UPI00381CB289